VRLRPRPASFPTQGNNKLRIINPATLTVTTLAGPPPSVNLPNSLTDGIGTSAGFWYPAGLLILPTGTIVVAENGFNTLGSSRFRSRSRPATRPGTTWR